MKKIFTLFFSVALLSIAASAQERRHYDDDSYKNSQRYPSYYNGFRDGDDHNWNDEGYGRFDHDGRFHRGDWYERRHWRHRDDAVIYRRDGYYDNRDFDHFRDRRNLSLQIVIGRKHRY